ncbi:TRAP transporter small permease [Antarcticimicrobium sediminis]|uniref:TRAP transporter small permease protein n=1 Tax=Antarcticimicrobium sediminis TaxID=2546227 RepID=A0A4R5ELS9_9RHOB|nr:TRAP transporter small permease [Antarcticimicrobium sediminis]TDE35651.1 TRAP transporter small permease [Antarcticimicrobium sediminis]
MNTLTRIAMRAMQVASSTAFAVGGACMVAMMVHIFADVLLRGLFSMPLTGTLEIVSSYYMVAVSFMPLAALELSRDLVFVEVFTQRMSLRRRRAMDAFARLLSLLAMGLIALSAGQYALKQTKRGEFMDVVYFDLPIWPTRWIAAVGFGLAAFAAIAVFIRTLRDRLHGASEPAPEQSAIGPDHGAVD